MKFKLVSENATIPMRATEHSAGFDIVPALDKPLKMEQGIVYKISTGLAAEIPTGYVGLLAVRSSVGAKYGVSLAGSIGVIDSDYRGEIFAPLVCNKSEGFTITPGERMVQLVVVPILIDTVEIVDKLSDTERGTGGFGSTGRFKVNK